MLLKTTLQVFFLALTSARSCGEFKPFHLYTKSEIAYLACDLQISLVAHFCAANDGSCNRCTSPDYLSTLAGCLKDEQNVGMEEYFIRKCWHEFSVNITRELWLEAYHNYTTFTTLSSNKVRATLLTPLVNSVLLNSTQTKSYKRAYNQYYENFNKSFYFGCGVLAFWGTTFLIAAMCHWTKWFCPNLMRRMTGPISNTIRRHITLPALGRKSRANESSSWRFVKYLAPTRSESIVIFLFCGSVIVCTCLDMEWEDGNPMFESKSVAICRLLADRTGIIASALVPMLILFAGRNNILQWITGWSFATYIQYHKWVARVVVLLVIIHSVAFTIIFVKQGRYTSTMMRECVIWATIGTISGSFIFAQSMLVLRRRYYELFLVTHIILAALFIAGSWKHVNHLGYTCFFYAATAVWATDRVVRLCRLLYFGCPKAEIRLLADETLKVTIPKPKYWSATPGGHAFLHFIRPTCFWQSHPFTFTSLAAGNASGDKVVMYLKVKGGVTHSLYQYLIASPGKRATIRVSLEGPYGENTAARNYDTAVFVAGGNGIPGTYSEVYALANRVDTKQKLELHWVIRDHKSIEWFTEELEALRNTSIHCVVHVTKPTHNPYALSKEIFAADKFYFSSEKVPNRDRYIVSTCSCDSMSDASVIGYGDLNHIEFRMGRPNVENLVRKNIAESKGSVAFIACGHPLMVDELRYQVASSLGETQGKRVDFFEQLQVWA